MREIFLSSSLAEVDDFGLARSPFSDPELSPHSLLLSSVRPGMPEESVDDCVDEPCESDGICGAVMMGSQGGEI